MTARIAVFAGTQEGHDLCSRLSAAGVEATCFVATEYGAQLVEGLPGIEVRQGRLDEAAMERELAGATLVVDATHPYAVEVSANVRAATAALGIDYLRLLRPSGAAGNDVAQDGDNPRVLLAANAAEAAAKIAGLPGRVLITTGAKDLAAYTAVPGFSERLVVRVLPAVESLTRALELGFAAKNVICMQGPFSQELNVATLKQVDASWLVTKDTGAVGGLPQKLAAAREAGCGVVLISRPDAAEKGFSLEEVFDACLAGR